MTLQLFSKTTLSFTAILLPLAVTVSLVQTDGQQKTDEPQPEEKVSLSGEQAKVLDSVFELAFQPDSKRKYRLLHRKFLNEFIPNIYGGLAWSGVTPNPTPEQAAANRKRYDFFMKEVGEVLNDKPFNMNNIEVWRSIPREEIIDLALRLQDGLQDKGKTFQGFLEPLAPFESNSIRSVDVQIQGEVATVAIQGNSGTLVFEMEKNEKTWQMVKFNNEPN